MNTLPFTTYGNPPKTLIKACLRHADKITEVGNEGEDGYWVYLKNGWWNESDTVSCIHEWNVRSAIGKLSCIKPDPRPEHLR